MKKPTSTWKHFKELEDEGYSESDIIRIVALAWDRKEYEVSIMFTAYIEDKEEKNEV